MERIKLAVITRSFFCLSLLLFSAPSFCAEKIGFYSGTFDPPSLAHISIIESFARLAELDHLYIVVNNMTEKEPFTSSFDRVALVESLLAPKGLEKKVTVMSQLFLDRTQIFADLMSAHPKATFAQLAGEDHLLTYFKEFAARGCEFWIAPRETGQPTPTDLSAFENRIHFLPRLSQTLHELSSTQIRTELFSGIFDPEKTSPITLKKIKEKNLYQVTEARGEYEKRWSDLTRNLKRDFGYTMDLGAAPEFSNRENRNAWDEKFIRVILRRLTENQAAELRPFLGAWMLSYSDFSLDPRLMPPNLAEITTACEVLALESKRLAQ